MIAKPKRLKLKVKEPTFKPFIVQNKNQINIFELGTLIQFETHIWQARKKLPKEIVKRLTPNAQKSLVSANKTLIDKSHLKNINQIITKARQYISDITNPFPISGVHFVKKELLPNITSKLDEFIASLKEEVDIFCEQYNEFINDACVELSADKLFNENDYPHVDEVKHKFSIKYRFFDLTIPTGISNDLRKQEIENFKNLMGQTKEMSILAMRKGFSEIITHLTESLTGKIEEDKRLHKSSLDKISEFFTSFQNKNMFNDAELEKMINNALSIIDGVDVNVLRNNHSFAQSINNQLKTVKAEIDSCIVDYKRKVSFI